ncbi:MAG TPA: C45 family autoproteolytic acyltransferase/hydrolase [Spirochaetota bacterium]|nr:C45 family autoproteolytic acyltransferase/hydrolase [Spirochaetota bacterium]
MRRRFLKIAKYSSAGFAVLAVVFFVYLYFSVMLHEPAPDNRSIEKESPVLINGSLYSFGKSRIRKSENGLWEMYIEGDPYERGVAAGKLSSALVGLQEKYFIDQIKVMIPSDTYLNILKVFVAWFNRDLDKYIKQEYLSEIYGISRSAPDAYDYIGPKYQRMLNYHGAHDIGHALVNMHLVGCTSFSVKGSYTSDGKMLIGRNFDFNMGDDFAKDKIVAFYAPSSGYKYMMVTWGGMTGVVSGMNEAGLTVTINAAENDIPKSVATPIALIAREILQYSQNIDEAYSIASKRKSFVAESIMIGSAKDKKTVIIEKKPDKTDIYDTGNDLIISTNHFLKNKAAIQEESSVYRFNRVNEMISGKKGMKVDDVAYILRDMKGKNGADIGEGNEKTINQLAAHHSIIFKPEDLIVWVSTSPYQFGRYAAYDLRKVFIEFAKLQKDKEINEFDKQIGESRVLKTKQFSDAMEYKRLTGVIKSAISNRNVFTDAEIDLYVKTNPQMYLVYQLVGDYYYSRNDSVNAKKYYSAAMTKEIARLAERKKIEESIVKCDEKK